MSQPTTSNAYFPALRMRTRSKVLLYKEIAPFAWPIFIELSCVVLMGIISTVLVSQIGPMETAAVGISDSVTYIIVALLMAIALGGTVVVAQATGSRNNTKALNGSVQVMKLNFLLGVACFVFIQLIVEQVLYGVAFGADSDVIDMSELYLRTISYSYPAMAITFAGSGVLRAVGNTRFPAMTNIAMNLLNILISYPLIYGLDGLGLGSWPGWGITGAGIGVTISRWIGAVMIIVVLVKNPIISIRLKDYLRPFQIQSQKEILLIGLPASVESLMFNAGKLITQMLVASMGTVSMAGNVIAFSVVLLLNIPGNTLGMTATVLIGKRLGQDRPDIASHLMKLVLQVSTAMCVVLGILCIPFAGVIAQVYTSEPDVIEVVVNLVILNGLMMLVWPAAWVLPASFKGAKDVKYSMVVSIASMWGCRIVLGYILGVVLGFGVYGVWLGMFVDWIVRGGLFYWRMVSRGWLKVYLAAKAP